MRILERPGRVILHERLDVLRRTPARQDARAPGEHGRAPFAQRLNVGRAMLGQDVAGEMIAPHQQRHLQLEPWKRILAMDDDMIRRAVLKAMDTNETERVRDVSEPESAGIEQMRTEIGQHAGALIAPRGITHQPSRAVAVEHAAGIDRTELSRRNEIPHPYEVRFKTMIVGGIADDAALARQHLEPGDLAFVLRPQRLLDQHMLAVFEAIGEKLDLGLVGDARQHRIVVGERSVRDRAVARLQIDGIDRGDEVVAGDPTTLVTLNSEARDHDSHRWSAQRGAICRSMASIFERRSSAVTGMFPSHSHSTAAATVPRMVAIPGSRTTSIASVA